MPKEFANLNPATVADSEKNYQAVKARFEVPNKKSLRQSWCKLNLRERGIKADFEEMYSAVYGSVSELSHGSFRGLAQHVESVIGDNWQPAIPPSTYRLFAGTANCPLLRLPSRTNNRSIDGVQ